jgi:hypothetical protein
MIHAGADQEKNTRSAIIPIKLICPYTENYNSQIVNECLFFLLPPLLCLALDGRSRMIGS